jgi:hypothetical protein
MRAVPVLETWPSIEEMLRKEIELAVYGDAPIDEAIAHAIEYTRPYFFNTEGH